VRIRDLGSTNGTLVNGTRVVDERPLQDGDLLQLGPLVLQLRLSSLSPAPDTVETFLPSSGTTEVRPLGG
jgi:pSer/pThr/pTyr-binding forkhead associated (FHA) protein